MTDSSVSATRVPAILVLVATFVMIGFNVLAASGRVNGVSPEQISNNYPTPLTPAGYAFAIWSIIYLGLAAFSIYQFVRLNSAKFTRLRGLFVLSCVLNCGWIYFWHHDKIGVCFVMIVLLAATLFLINSILRTTDGMGEFWLVKAPFSIYFGWVTAAAVVNFAVMLVYLQTGLSNETWTLIAVILILLSASLGIAVRIGLLNYLHPLAIAWALTAIAVKQSGHTAIVVACAFGVVASLIATLSFVVKLPTHTVSQPAAK